VGDVGGVIMKDCMFVFPRRDLDVPESERMITLTDQFLKDFGILLGAGPVVLFFDAVEKMTEETRRWVWCELVRAICDGRLPNLLLVQMGRDQPDLDRELERVVETAVLGPLGYADIVHYLQKRGVEAARWDPLAAMVLGHSRGRPVEVASMVDTYEMVVKKRAT
jgi:hypothetical protein